jgi:hypothetical protein
MFGFLCVGRAAVTVEIVSSEMIDNQRFGCECFGLPWKRDTSKSKGTTTPLTVNVSLYC